MEWLCLSHGRTIKNTVMRLYNEIQSENLSNLLLYGAIMFASIDYIGVLDYVIKAVLGGAVWFGFKLLQDYYSVKVKNKAKTQTEIKDGKERV